MMTSNLKKYSIGIKLLSQVTFLFLISCFLILLNFFDIQEGFVFFSFSLFFGMILIISYEFLEPHITAIFCFFFFAFGINTPYFYFFRKNYSKTDWAAVGDFDFSIASLFNSYIPVFLVSLIILIIGFLFFYAQMDSERESSFTMNNGLASRTDKSLFYIFIIVFSAFYIWMYENKIAMIGVTIDNAKVTVLPLKLNGIFYFVRLLIGPTVLAWLLFRLNISLDILACSFLFAILGGITGASRVVYILTMFPIIFFYINKMRGWIRYLPIFLLLFGDAYISLSKELIYTGRTYSFITQIVETTKQCFIRPDGGILSVLWSATGRLGGGQSIILANTKIANHSFWHGYINTLSGKEPIDNMAKILFGFEVETGFGVNLGFPAHLVLSAQGEFTKLVLVSLTIICYSKIIDVLINTALGGFKLIKQDVVFINFILLVLFFENRGFQITALIMVFIVSRETYKKLKVKYANYRRI